MRKRSVHFSHLQVCSSLRVQNVEVSGLQDREGWLSEWLEAMKRQAGRHWLQTDLCMSHRKKRTVFKSAVIEKGGGGKGNNTKQK